MESLRIALSKFGFIAFNVVVIYSMANTSSFAQQVTASVSGSVIDPSGAPIANATVTAKDVDRGTSFPVVTNQDGVYTLPRLPVGTYELRAEATGFQTAVTRMELVMNQNARMDFEMRVGQVTETMDVTSAAPLLQTDTTELGTIIDARTNATLPLATRNYVQLTLLAPGSVNPNPESMTGSSGTTANSGRPYVNGNREQANNFLLDGIDNNQVSDNLVGYAPSVDAIQEFNMITNNASAEFGNFQGGIVSVTIKSGINELHGSAFEFFRNDVLNANRWENKWSAPAGTQLPREPVRWNMFGGSAGGPIIKNKLFFFADYQGQRFNRPASVSTLTVFTAAERTGDFSQLLRERGVQLYNPFSVDANGNRAPFPNNQIPLALLDPVARALFSSNLYPLPFNDLLQNNALNTARSQTHADQGDAKVDATITDKDRMFVRYSQSQQSSPSTNSFPLLFGSFFDAPTRSGVVNYTRTFGPSLVNEVRAGINYVKVNNGGVDNGIGNVAQEFGIPGVNDRSPGLLGLNFNSALVSGIGSSNIGTQQLFANTVFQLSDAVIATVGKHVLHTGFQITRRYLNTFYAGNNGRTGFMTYAGKYTAGPSAGAVASGTAGAGEADFFLGLPTELGRGVNTGTWGHRDNVYSLYLQDDWRIRRNLTLNLGLRYENTTPWVEVADRQVNFAPFTGEIQFAGKSNYYSNNRALYNSYNSGFDFQPRIGFAYTPGIMGGTFVIRGAYTISSYLEGTGTNLRLPLNPPYNQEFDTRYDSTDLALPLSRTSQGLTVLQSATDPFAGANIRLWDPNVRPGGIQQWNFSIQKQLGTNSTLQAGYVGQKNTHLAVPMPYAQLRLLPDGSVAPSPYLSGNPALSSIAQISGTESNGTQSYNALQAVLVKRYSGGLQGQVAYTYSKCMTDSIGYYGAGGQAAPTSAYWQNLYNKKAEWGPCYYDVTHILTTYALWEIPFGRTRKYGKDMNRAVNAVIGDWSLSGIYTAHGGFPLTISAGDASGTKSRGARANCVAPADVFGRQDSPAGGYQWFDPNSYAAPTPHTFGTCGVGTVRGPGLSRLDMSVLKNFLITERTRVEFRSEFLNLTNTPILNSPNTGLGADLGRLTSSQGPRNIQFALKLYF